MDLELLREFQVFAVSQNLSKAAKVLHVTQSCLSKHIAEIERTTGLSLLDHGPKSVSLTPVGECFLREVSPIVSSYDNCLIKCRKLQQRYDNMLKVQLLLDGNIVNGLLFQLRNEFKMLHPECEVIFEKLIGYTPESALPLRIFDVTLACRCGDLRTYEEECAHAGIRVLPLKKDPIIVWLSKENPLAQAERLTLDMLDCTPIMTSVTDAFDYIREATETLFEFHGMVAFMKPVHFDIASPAAFFLSDFDRRAVMLTSSGMLGNAGLSERDDICWKQLDGGDTVMTVCMCALVENRRANEFLDFAEVSLGDHGA